jgi:hypothetical protein
MDGDGDYINVSHAPEFEAANGTIMTWVKFDSLGTDQYLYSKNLLNCPGDCGHTQLQYDMPNAPDQFWGRLQNDGNGWHYNVTSDEAILSVQTDEWYHLAMTWGNGVRLYVNGIEHDVNTDTEKGIINNGIPLIIGAGNSGGLGLFGTMDEFKFYSRTFSADEIMEEYLDVE